MKELLKFCIPVFLVFTGCAVQQSGFQPTATSHREALATGKIKEFFAVMEAQASEAEKNAATSYFPRTIQQHLETAVAAYEWAAISANNIGQLQKAIAYGEKSLEMADKSRDPAHLFQAIESLVGVYRTIRNFEKAKQLIERGLAVAKGLPPNQNPRSYWEGHLYSHLGTELVRRREYENGIETLSLSVSLQQSYLSTVSRSPFWLNEHRGNLLLKLTSLGDAYRLAGKLNESAAQYGRAFDYIKEWGLKYAWETSLYGRMGEIQYQKKDYPQALDNFQKVLSQSESRQIPADIRWASSRIGDILRQSGNLVEAILYYRKAIQQIESTRSFIAQEDFRQSFFEGATASYISLMRALLSTGQREEAFNFSERARSRVFLDVLGSKAQLSKLKSGLFEEERTLQERIAAVKARLSGEEDGAINRAGLDKELVAAEQGYNAFLAKVRKQDKEQASLMSVEPLTLKQVQELIEPAQTLIEYFVTDSEVFVWVVEKDKLNFQRVAISKTELTKQVKTLREIISNPGDAQSKLNEVSIALYKSLIQPLLPHISGKELIVVPHDVLHYLPFQALLGSDGKYLIEKYPISYLSSASLLQFVKEKRTTGRERVLAFGNPDLGDPEKDLEFAELEAREVKSIYPEANVFVRKEATEEKSKALSAHHDILHFATHAQFNEDDPLSSAVLLAARGRSPIFTKR